LHDSPCSILVALRNEAHMLVQQPLCPLGNDYVIFHFFSPLLLSWLIKCSPTRLMCSQTNRPAGPLLPQPKFRVVAAFFHGA